MGRVSRLDSGSLKIKASPSKWVEWYDATMGIKSWGSDNLYPQRLLDLIENSPNASVCARRMADFIAGDGIDNTIMVNSQQTLDDLVYDCADSISKFGGFALHIRYNGLAEIVSIRAMPIEGIRIGEIDDNGYISKYVWCDDWEGERTKAGKAINPLTDNIEYFPFSPNKNDVLLRMYGNNTPTAELARQYKGEILYVSNRYYYPKGCGTTVLTNMSTDEGISNISYRNTRCNFLPASLVCYQKNADDAANRAFLNGLQSMQGDENTSTVMAVGLDDITSSKPEVTPFPTTNYDKEFSVTAEATAKAIYCSWKAENFYLLREGKIGFGGEVLSSAYNTYNLAVKSEKRMIESTLTKIKSNFSALYNVDIKIKPLVYATTGDDNNELNKQDL